MAIKNSQAPLIQQGWQRAIVFCAAYVLATYLVIMIASGGIVAAMASKGETSISLQTLNTLSLVVVAVVSIVLSIVFRLYVDRKPVVSLGLDINQHRNDIVSGLLLSILLMGLGSLILYFSSVLSWVDVRFAGSDFFMALVLMIIVAVSEEMVFRGYLLNNLMESMNKWVALLVSALLFTMSHIFNPNLNALAIINIFLGGLLLGINFIYTRTLWFAIALHFGWNFIQGHVLGFAVSGFDEPTLLEQELKGHPLLTGNGFGFEGSIVATGVMMAGIALCYYVYERKSKNLPTF